MAKWVSAAALAVCACGGDGGGAPDARQLDASAGFDAGTTDAGDSVDAAGLDAMPSYDAVPPDAGIPDATPNAAPTITDIADQITQFPPVGPLVFTIDDAETIVTDLIVTAESNNQAVVPDGNLLLEGTDANRMITVTPAAGGVATITVTVSDGDQSASDTFDVSVTNSVPVGSADAYDWFGNTALSVADTAGVLINDIDNDNTDTITAVAVTGGATTLGGSYDLAVDGSFTYRPPVGITGMSDTFSYGVTDGFEVGAGTVTIDLTERVWYVDNTAAANGDGRSHTPFDTLAEAESAADAGDIIFVFAGDGTTTGQSDGISLQDGQSLIGEGVGLEIDAVTIIAAGSNPVITNTSGVGVLLNGSTTVRGLTIESPNNDGINGNLITGAVIRDNVITAAGAQAIDIGNTTVNGTINVEIRGNTLGGNGTDFTTTTLAVDMSFQGTGGGTVVAEVRDNIIYGVNVGILVDIGGNNGTGAGGANMVTIDNNLLADLDDDGIQIEPDDSASSEFFITNNDIDGVDAIVAATPAIGIDLRCRTGALGVTEATITGNTVTDMGGEGFNLVSTGSNNGGTLTMLIDDNTITGVGSDGMTVAVDDAVTINATVTNNTMTGNTNASSFEFFTGTANVLNLNLANNEDSVGFRLERDAVGVFRLAGTLGQGMSFSDDNGNVANNGNTTGAGAPTVTIAGTAGAFEIVDSSTITVP